MRFDLTDLRLFLHVAEAASITGGAARAGLALASASARIRGMEMDFGTALLRRERRGVRLTPAGLVLQHHARAVDRQLEHMRGDLASYAQGLRGHVRLLANTAAAAEFLPEPLAEYLAANPDIDVELEERPSHEIVAAVAGGFADAGIVADTVDLGELEIHPFALDRLVVVGRRDHPALAGRRRMAFADVTEHELIGLGAGSALQAHLGQHAARAGRTLKLRVRLANLDAVCRMAGMGVGLAVVPERAARRSRRSIGLRIVPLADAWAVRRLNICTRRLDDLPVHARRLIERLRLQGESLPGARPAVAS